MKSITEQIKSARLAAGLTQKEVAEKTGIALVSYKRIETGKRWPSQEYLLKLSKVLKTAFIISSKSGYI